MSLGMQNVERFKMKTTRTLAHYQDVLGGVSIAGSDPKQPFSYLTRRRRLIVHLLHSVTLVPGTMLCYVFFSGEGYAMARSSFGALKPLHTSSKCVDPKTRVSSYGGVKLAALPRICRVN